MHTKRQTVVIEGDKHMNTTRPAATIGGVSSRKIAIAAGVFYLVTHVTSVGALILYGPALFSTGYIIDSGPDTRVLLGAFFEVILAFAVVGTAVTLFPVVRRQNEGVALGYVSLRTLEAATILLGVVSLLAVVTLRQPGIAGTDQATLVTVGQALVAVHNWTFLVGPSFTSGVNTVLMAYLMYRSGLVARFIPVLGLIGGPLVFASATAVLFGLLGQYSVWTAIASLPEFAWELTLAFWLIVKGFNPPAIASESAKMETNELVSAV